MRHLRKNLTSQAQAPYLLQLILFILCSPLLTAQTTRDSPKQRLQPLDFQRMMQPVPETAAFRDPGYYVWCGTMIEDKIGIYHLYYSRWKNSAGPNGWLTSSEVAHAIGRTP